MLSGPGHCASRANGDGLVSISNVEKRHPWLIWLVSYAFWSFIAVISAAAMARLNHIFGHDTTLWQQLKLPLVNNLIFATFTPILLHIGLRYPLQRGKWPVRSLFYSAGALVFTAAHVLVRILVYPVTEGVSGKAIPLSWSLYQRVFLYDLTEDCFYIYLPIVLFTHVLLYYQEAQERELRTSQLETRLVQAQLKALKSQLQPHFLFNTLHSISSLMLTNVNAADSMIARLSDLLRMSLEGSTWQETTLNRELQFVNGYLEIEKMRYGERLKVRTAIDSNTLDARVPHLLLQPLVENAIRHGIGKLPDGGEVWLSARRENSHLHIQVGDSGPGFAFNREWNAKHGLGLTTTRERLAGLYGDRQRLDLRSTPGRGTVVHVYVPFNTNPVSRVYELESIHGLG